MGAEESTQTGADGLTIRLFGPTRLMRGSRRVRAFPTRRATSLFCFLAVHPGRMYSRDALANLFWGDRTDSDARKCLRTSLWRVRSVVERDSSPVGTVIAVRSDQIGFQPESPYWLDVEQFEDIVTSVSSDPLAPLSPAEASELEDAVRLYTGELCEAVYDEWCYHEQERLRSLYGQVLERLMQYHIGRRSWHAAVDYGQRILDKHPLREQIHRILMRCHYEAGDRAAAIRQYRRCESLLVRELGIQPMHETLALLEAIRCEDRERVGSISPNARRDRAPEMPKSLGSEAFRDFYTARHHLDQATHAIDRGIEEMEGDPDE